MVDIYKRLRELREEELSLYHPDWKSVVTKGNFCGWAERTGNTMIFHSLNVDAAKEIIFHYKRFIKYEDSTH